MDVVDQAAENDLRAPKDASGNKLRWEDMVNRLHQMESMLKKKFEDLDAKEEELAKRKSEILRVIAEREAVLTAKEQDLLDHIQELKDTEASKALKNNQVEPYNATDEYYPIPLQEKRYIHDLAENTGAPCVKDKRYWDLILSCELMDANGLLKFLMENQKDLLAVRSKLYVALFGAPEPARLVLKLLRGFFPSPTGSDDALKGLRQSLFVIMEVLASVSTCVDNFLNVEIQAQAKAIADEWMPKLTVEGFYAAGGDGNSFEIEGFLRLLTVYRIALQFDQDKLCKLVLAVAYHHKPDTKLCHSLGLTQKMPEKIEALISSAKLIDAVHLIQASELSDTYPPVPLLMAYLKDIQKKINGTSASSRRDASLKDFNRNWELTALKTVVKCIKNYKLQAEYPLGSLENRIAKLTKSKPDDDKKRIDGELGRYEQLHQYQKPKKARTNGGFNGYHTGRIGSSTSFPERFPHAADMTYSYPLASEFSFAVPEMPERYTSYDYYAC